MARISGENPREIYGQLPKDIYQAYRQYARSFWAAGRLEPSLRELLRLKSAKLHACKWWMVRRIAEAQQDGLTEEKIAKVDHYAESDLSDREKLALEFAELLTFNAHAATDAFFHRLKEQFSEAEIMELAFTITFYGGVHRINAAIGLEPEDDHGLVVQRML